MYGARNATMMVLAERGLDQSVINALESAAKALGHGTGCCIVTLGEVDDLALFILESDPWAVVGIDGPSIEALRTAFGGESEQLAPGTPVLSGGGYLLVAVPGFAECLDDQAAKRVAWNRLKAARHPGNPLG